MLVVLAALWGASYLFMRIAAPVLGPVALIGIRVALASLALYLYMAALSRRPHLWHRWKEYLLLGLINSALPFTLIATAELHITASLASVMNAMTPLCAALVAWGWTKQPLTSRKLSGLVLGVVGVGVLLGLNPHKGGIDVGFALLSLLASVSYGFGGVYAAKAFPGENPIDMAVGQQLGATVFMLPLAVGTVPLVAPSGVVVFSVLALSILCTSLAYLLYFPLLQRVGPVRTLSVTFLIPVFGILWGHLFLQEAVTPTIIAGLALVLVSVALVADLPFGRSARGRRAQGA